MMKSLQQWENKALHEQVLESLGIPPQRFTHDETEVGNSQFGTTGPMAGPPNMPEPNMPEPNMPEPDSTAPSSLSGGLVKRPENVYRVTMKELEDVEPHRPTSRPGGNFERAAGLGDYGMDNVARSTFGREPYGPGSRPTISRGIPVGNLKGQFESFAQYCKFREESFHGPGGVGGNGASGGPAQGGTLNPQGGNLNPNDTRKPPNVSQLIDKSPLKGAEKQLASKLATMPADQMNQVTNVVRSVQTQAG